MNYFLENMLPEERELLPYLPTTAEYLQFITARYGEKTALSDPDRAVDYTALVEQTAAKRALLNELRIPRGVCVGLMGKNSLDAAEWFLAISSYGCTAVMMPPSLHAEALPGILAHFEIQLLITDVEAPLSAGQIGGVPVLSVIAAGNGADGGAWPELHGFSHADDADRR